MTHYPPRKILVTGASRGIGAAITRHLLQDGYAIVGIGRDFSDWNELPEGLEAIELDLADLVDPVFHRILQGDNVNIRLVDLF